MLEQEIVQTSEWSFHAGFSYPLLGRTQNRWCSLGLIPIDCGNVKLSQIALFEARSQRLRHKGSLCCVHHNWDLVTSEKWNWSYETHDCYKVSASLWGQTGSKISVVSAIPERYWRAPSHSSDASIMLKSGIFMSLLEGEGHSRYRSMLIAGCLPRCATEAQNCISKQAFKSYWYVEVCCLFHINKSFLNIPWFIPLSVCLDLYSSIEMGICQWSWSSI